MAEIRLQKYLSQCGVASRRSAEELMRQGQVEVNGQKATNPGVKIDPDKDKVVVENKLVVLPQSENVYVLLNKPKGYITTVKDVHAEKTVFDLLKEVPEKVFPVGRLDKDTCGLLLFTNDGDLCYKLTHPKFEIEKTYYLKISGTLKNSDITCLEEGILVDGVKTRPAKVEIISRNNDFTEIKLIICEGKKRQIRIMVNSLGYFLKDLKRIKFGPIELGNLKEGKIRYLTKEEIKKLKV